MKGNNNTFLIRNLLCLILCVIIIAIVAVLAYTKHTENEMRAAYYEELGRQQRKDKLAEEEAREELLLTSSFYQKLSNGFDVNVLILGDEIAAGKGASDHAHSWTSLLVNNLKDTYGVSVKLTNLAVESSTCYTGYVNTMKQNDGMTYDLAIICYGETDSEWNFSLSYESVIRAIENKYPKCSVISILESSQKEYTLKMQGIQNLCNHYRIPVADTIAAFQGNTENLIAEEIYPNDIGQQIYADTLMKVIGENVDAYVGYPTYPATYVKEWTATYENFRYISKEEFTRTENTYRIDMACEGILGIEFADAYPVKELEAYADGEKIENVALPIDQSLTSQNIFIVTNDCVTEETLEIRLKTPEEADRFKGIMISWGQTP